MDSITVSIKEHQIVGPFDEAEFFAPGPVLTVESDYSGRVITVERAGESRFTLADEITDFRTEDHALLRETYPDGVLPAERVEFNNGWFVLYEYENGSDEVEDSICHSLQEALAQAKELAEERLFHPDKSCDEVDCLGAHP